MKDIKPALTNILANIREELEKQPGPDEIFTIQFELLSKMIIFMQDSCIRFKCDFDSVIRDILKETPLRHPPVQFNFTNTLDKAAFGKIIENVLRHISQEVNKIPDFPSQIIGIDAIIYCLLAQLIYPGAENSNVVRETIDRLADKMVAGFEKIHAVEH